MRLNRIVKSLSVLLFVLMLSQSAFAQRWEAYAYGGNIWSGNWRDQFKVDDNATWGARFGGYFTDRFQIDGGFGYMNHFRFQDNPRPFRLNFDPLLVDEPSVRGVIWETNISANFFGTPVNQSNKFVPYLTAGVGGITTVVKDGGIIDDRTDAIVLLARNHPEEAVTLPAVTVPSVITPILDPTAIVLESGDTFFTVNYGGGIKSHQLWGPLGLRIDFLGRSMPNFFGNSLSFFQLSGGVNFAWGER